MKERVEFIDFARGIAVCGMIAYHAVFLLEYFFLYDLNLISNYWFEFFANIFRFLFLFLVGVSAYLFSKKKYSNIDRLKKQFKRLFTIILAASLVSFFTYLFDSSNFIFFGVLHNIALTSLLFIFFSRHFKIQIILLFILFISNFINFRSESFILQILGYTNLLRSTLDFFPIFPWTLFAILGFLSSKYFMPIYITLSRLCKCTFITNVGKNSLLIYVVHVPIIFIVIYILELVVLS